MRALYNEHYKKGRGFTTEDMILIINRLTKKDYHDFYNKYVFGTDVPDYDRIFGYAGYRLEKKTEQAPELGFNGRFRSGGLTVNSVEPGSGAAAAGLKVGDVVTKIDGKSLQAVAFNTLAGRTVPLTVMRGGAETQINVAIGSRPVMNYALTAIANPTAQQTKIRQGWLAR
jgi:predicted metalloprotease with PDZ domain